jgi:hypothetical protein
MFSRWVRTVPSDRPSLREIWALVCPAATSLSRSQCGGVLLIFRTADPYRIFTERTGSSAKEIQEFLA